MNKIKPGSKIAIEIKQLTKTELEAVGLIIKSHLEAEAYLRHKNIGLSIKDNADVMMEKAYQSLGN